MNKLLTFKDEDIIGAVTHVDTGQIVVEIDSVLILNRISVGNLVVIETHKEHQKLVALVDKVTRKYVDDYYDDDTMENEICSSSADFIRVSIIGTFHDVLGNEHNVFKRGIDTFPQIESKCYCLSGTNLQKFMNILSQNVDDEKKLKIGAFMMDKNAEAILDGNKFFQRHAAILGSTGSGKSWCVANILGFCIILNPNKINVF